ncbi:hypothetical protein [Jannaschia sp. 2305UL9-9]|uniref:hypothetical protein n=1 Tax=Jannaschia sp. 2305UL9-9 TaxID=3121638 RepID=UPI003529AF33
MAIETPVRTLCDVEEALDDGGRIEVECLTSAWREGSVWCGEWRLYVCSTDEDAKSVRELLVTQRSREPKVIRSVHGLVRLATDLGIDLPQIPLSEGQMGVWARGQVHAENIG